MSGFVAVAEANQVPLDRGLSVHVGGRELALFNISGQFYALDGRCPHRGGPLGEGDIIASEIVCPWHLWSFEIETGVCVGNPEIRIATHDVRVEGDRVLVRLT